MIFKLSCQTSDGSIRELEIHQIDNNTTFYQFIETKFGGLDLALNYVRSKYGVGGYCISAHRDDGTYLDAQKFSTFASPTCTCSSQTLFNHGCQCGFIQSSKN